MQAPNGKSANSDRPLRLRPTSNLTRAELVDPALRDFPMRYARIVTFPTAFSRLDEGPSAVTTRIMMMSIANQNKSWDCEIGRTMETRNV
jgi:hypothetical protein